MMNLHHGSYFAHIRDDFACDCLRLCGYHLIDERIRITRLRWRLARCDLRLGALGEMFDSQAR
jgi:hypothetical protein